MKSSVRLSLAKRIQSLRRRKGLTQEELATSTGIDYKYIQKIEGKNPPAIRVDSIEKIAKGLRVPLWKLLQFRD